MKPCYKCGSSRWECFDEHDVECMDASGEIYSIPEGWIKCKDCGATWSDGGCDDGDEEIFEEQISDRDY